MICRLHKFMSYVERGDELITGIFLTPGAVRAVNILNNL